MSLAKKLRNVFVGASLVSTLLSVNPQQSNSIPMNLNLNDISTTREYTPKKQLQLNKKQSVYRINPRDNYELDEFFLNVSDATVYLEAGQYDSRGADLRDVNLRAVNPIDFIHDEMAVNTDYKDVTGAYSLIKGDLILDGTSSVSGIIANNESSFALIVKGRNHIDNTLIKDSWGGMVIVSYAKNVIVESSAIVNGYLGFSMRQVEEKGLAKVRNSVIKGNEVGFLSVGHLDLGDIIDKGNNIIGNEINIDNTDGVLLPAKWNWWYKPIQSISNATGTTQTTYKLLTTEEEILSTIINSVLENKLANNQQSNPSVDVVPFYDYDFFNPPTPTPTITPTQEPTETNTLIPTPTEIVEPNPTPQPTYTPYPTPTEKWNNADLNDDGLVDSRDLYLFMKEWRNRK